MFPCWAWAHRVPMLGMGTPCSHAGRGHLVFPCWAFTPPLRTVLPCWAWTPPSAHCVPLLGVGTSCSPAGRGHRLLHTVLPCWAWTQESKKGSQGTMIVTCATNTARVYFSIQNHKSQEFATLCLRVQQIKRRAIEFHRQQTHTHTPLTAIKSKQMVTKNALSVPFNKHQQMMITFKLSPDLQTHSLGDCFNHCFILLEEYLLRSTSLGGGGRGGSIASFLLVAFLPLSAILHHPPQQS